MECLYITYKEYHSGGEAISDGPYTDREDLQIDAYVTKVSLSKPDSYLYDTIDLIDGEFISGDEAHLVTVRYSDGDTFGASYGHFHVESAHKTYKDAEAEVKIIKQDNKDHPRMEWDQKNPRKYQSAIWKGYFNALEYVTVESFTVYP